MKQIPESQKDIKRLLYEQAPLLIKKLEMCDAHGAREIIEAIIQIISVSF